MVWHQLKWHDDLNQSSNDTNLSTKGDGIGLYIVRENISKLGDCIEVDSDLGIGSTFKIELPIETENK